MTGIIQMQMDQHIHDGCKMAQAGIILMIMEICMATDG